MRTKFMLLFATVVLLSTVNVAAADFGSKGGAEPSNIDEIETVLHQDAYEMELLISFGTSKGGSAGHLALSLRDEISGAERVYSANFYADRSREHEHGFYTKDLMIAVPKVEYLFKTVSSLDETASFGLDFGEVYKRSVIGVRVYGVPTGEKQAIAAYFGRINEDYHHRARRTEYYDREVKYDYLRLNCARAIGAAFKFGAGYKNLDVNSARLLSGRRVVAALTANIPTEMAMKLVKEWDERGYGMDVVLYKKYSGSSYVDPHEEEKVAFKDLPNRFPSVRSRDFGSEQDAYQDFDNLYAAYLLDNMKKYTVSVNGETQRLELTRFTPMAYPEATKAAALSAKSDSESYELHVPFKPKSAKFGDATDEVPSAR